MLPTALYLKDSDLILEKVQWHTTQSFFLNSELIHLPQLHEGAVIWHHTTMGKGLGCVCRQQYVVCLVNEMFWYIYKYKSVFSILYFVYIWTEAALLRVHLCIHLCVHMPKRHRFVMVSQVLFGNFCHRATGMLWVLMMEISTMKFQLL